MKRVSGKRTEVAMTYSIERKTLSDKVIYVINYIFLALIFIAVIVPLLYIISNSISNYRAIYAGKVWIWPVDISFASYKLVFMLPDIWRGYANTLYYMAAGTTINVFMTILAAYPLSRKDFKIRKPIIFLFSFTMYFGGGMIPAYILVRSLKMINTIWAITIPGAISVWNLIIMRTFFAFTIPEELLEAAKLDGCSDFRFLFRVVIPLSGAIIAVMALFYGVGHWNSYMAPLIYMNDSSKYPLQLVLRRILIPNDASFLARNVQITASMINSAVSSTSDAVIQQFQETIKYALIIISSLPVLIIYPFVQKYFVKGIMIGSLKG
jgi:multiple sugar transport system permease protein/putative aldouronate transport system permease protein